MLCSKCAADLPDGSHFCLKCGERVYTPGSIALRAAKTVLACSRCGASLPDDVICCLKCGYSVRPPAKVVPSLESPTAPDVTPLDLPRRRRQRRLALWFLLTILIAVTLWVATSEGPEAQQVQEFVGWKNDRTILDTPFSVGPHNFQYYEFSLPEGSVNVAVVGQFSSGSDSSIPSKRKDKDKDKDVDNNVEVYVLSEPAFTIWQNGYATASLYESGRVAEGKVQADLPAGAAIYYLVFSNKFALKASKTVHATILLRYKSWLPDWFRRTKDGFWNLLGL